MRQTTDRETPSSFHRSLCSRPYGARASVNKSKRAAVSENSSSNAFSVFSALQ
jgi:hypothetical protein